MCAQGLGSVGFCDGGGCLDVVRMRAGGGGDGEGSGLGLCGRGAVLRNAAWRAN